MYRLRHIHCARTAVSTCLLTALTYSAWLTFGAVLVMDVMILAQRFTLDTWYTLRCRRQQLLPVDRTCSPAQSFTLDRYIGSTTTFDSILLAAVLRLEGSRGTALRAPFAASWHCLLAPNRMT